MRLAFLVVALTLAATTASAQDDPQSEASQRFDRGLELFQEGRFDAAIAEFQRAYELAPAPQVLYNIGRVEAARGHAVEATTALEQYLREAGSSANARRRREVEAEIARQRARIALVWVRTNVSGAAVSVDGADVATTPLAEPLRISAGEHTVGAHAPGYDNATRAIDLAGGVTEEVRFVLRAAPTQGGTLRIAATLRDVEVLVDDHVVGLTPLSSTVPARAGMHSVVGRRPGYAAARVDVEVLDGAEANVTLELRPSARADASARGILRIALPDDEHSVRIDGDDTSELERQLPAGSHDLEVRVADRELFAGSVDVVAGETTRFAPPLRWTPEARASRIASADLQHVLGFVSGGLGIVLGGASIYGFAHASSVDESLVADRDRFTFCTTEPRPECLDFDDVTTRIDDGNSDVSTLRGVGLVAGIAGIAAIGAGIVLVLTADSEEDIDRAAHARAPFRIAF